MLANRYSELTKIGKGGSGITYSATDTKCDRAVAIKVLSLSGLDDWKKIELFEREAKILQQLNHYAIPKYIDYFQIETEDNIDFCLVQELATGQSLATLIDNGWQPDEDTVRNIAEKVLDILIYLQQLTPPVIHRDIKPQNIIYQPDTGKLFLVDFGAVQNTYHHTVMASTVVGTYGYMSPEQFRGGAVLSTDLYGLGCTLLFLLTGQSPTELPQSKLKINFRSLVKIKANFANWIEKLIEPDIADRFENARDAFDVLSGEVQFGQYTTRQIYKPKYSNIELLNKDDKKSFLIPPALFWRKYSLSCICWVSYSIFILLNIAIISLSNSWLGYAYGLLAILEIIVSRGWSTFLYLINIILILLLFIVVVLVRSEIVQLIPLSIIAIDTILLHYIRLKIIKDLLFTVRVNKITKSHSKYLMIERKIFNVWQSDSEKIWFKNFHQYMTIKSKSKQIGVLYIYYFGYLLTKQEKQWLQQEFQE